MTLRVPNATYPVEVRQTFQRLSDTFFDESSDVDHDATTNFVANEHIDHTAVSISAGTGLTGGGTIAANRTLSLSHLGIESLADPNADRILFWDDGEGACKWLAPDGTTIAISGTTLSVVAGGIDHGELVGLGDNDHPQYLLSTHLGIGSLSDPGGDRILFWNDSATSCAWLRPVGSLWIGGTDLYWGHLGIEDLSDPGATSLLCWNDILNECGWFTDGTGLEFWGNTLRTKDSEIVHDNLSGFVENEHIDWTNATENFLTTGNVTVDSDSSKLYFGDGQDASLYYDGSNLIVSSAEVGAGALKIIMNADQYNAIVIDGETNDCTAGYGDNPITLSVVRDVDAGSGNDLPQVTNIYSRLNLQHTDSIIEHHGINQALLFYLYNTGTIATGGRGRDYGLIGIRGSLNEQGTYDGPDGVDLEYKGNSTGVSATPTFNDTGADNPDYEIRAYGLSCSVNNQPTLNGGNLNVINYGAYITVTGKTAGTSTNYGLYLAAVQNADTNWAVWDASGANWALDGDNQKIMFGAGQDASLYYDGTNLYANPREIGVGKFMIAAPMYCQSTNNDDVVLEVDGYTNDFSTSGGSPKSVKCYLDIDYSTGNFGTSAFVFDNRCYHKSASAKITGDSSFFAFYNAYNNTGSLQNNSVDNRAFYCYPLGNRIDDTGTYDTASTGRLYIYTYGNTATMYITPTFTDSGGVSSGAARCISYGERVVLYNQPTLTSGTLTASAYGFAAKVVGNAAGSSLACGFCIEEVSGADVNYGILDLSGANWHIASDNQKIRLGATQGDFDIFSDGTDAEIDSTGDIFLNATGNVKFGTYAAITTETLQGYITIKDAAGNIRKIGVVA